MRIAVCMKLVPSDTQVMEEEGRLVRKNIGAMPDTCSLHALELARQLLQADEEKWLDVYTMGPPNAADVLKRGLALGADRAVLLTDRAFSGSDTLGTAEVLAVAINKLEHEAGKPYDLILFGAASSDGGTGQVGPMTAEALGRPSASHIVSAEAADGVCTAEKELPDAMGGGRLKLEIRLPAVLTVPYGANTPEKPKLRARMQASKKPIQTLSKEDLFPEADAETQPADYGGSAAKSAVTGSRLAMSTGRHAVMLAGTPAEQAAKICKILSEGGSGNG